MEISYKQTRMDRTSENWLSNSCGPRINSNKVKKNSFKNLVKIKAKVYCFFKLMKMKIKHTKMDNLFYSELRMQPYLKSNLFTAEQAKMIYSFRTRMSNFKENYRGSQGHSPCPLCFVHLDSQAMAFQCPTLKQEIKEKGNLDKIFSEKIPLDLVIKLTKILEYREHFPSCIHGEAGFNFPHGPWIMFLRTIVSSLVACFPSSEFWGKWMGSGGSCADITLSTSSLVFGLSSSERITRMWEWGRPLFWNSEMLELFQGLFQTWYLSSADPS